MKKVSCLLLFALAFACAAFADTVYTWTGTAGDGKWSTPNNWDKGSGYPSAADHIAQFGKSATVTVDTGAQLTIGYIKVTSGNVTVNGTAGSYLTLRSTTRWPTARPDMKTASWSCPAARSR